MLRLLLEGLIADDLNRRNQSLNINEVLEEVNLTTETPLNIPKADRSTQESEADEELTAEQLDFFGDGI